MDAHINLSESTLDVLGDRMMEPNEAVELLQEIMALLNGPDNPSSSIVHNVEDLPSAIQELLDEYNNLESTMGDIRDLSSHP